MRRRRVQLCALGGGVAIAVASWFVWLDHGSPNVYGVGAPDPSGQRDPDYISREVGTYRNVLLRSRTASRVNGEAVFAELWVETDEKGSPVRAVDRIFGPGGALRSATSRAAGGETIIIGPASAGAPGAESQACTVSRATGPPLSARYLPARFDASRLVAAGWAAVGHEAIDFEQANPRELLQAFPTTPWEPVRSVFAWAGPDHPRTRWVSELTDPSSDPRFVRLMAIEQQSGRPIGWRGLTVGSDGEVLETVESIILAVEVFPKTAETLGLFDLTSAEGGCAP